MKVHVGYHNIFKDINTIDQVMWPDAGDFVWFGDPGDLRAEAIDRMDKDGTFFAAPYGEGPAIQIWNLTAMTLGDDDFRTRGAFNSRFIHDKDVITDAKNCTLAIPYDPIVFFFEYRLPT